jgi:hypothetical protein
VTVAYAWHPRSGRLVFVHEVIERATGSWARCSLAGTDMVRLRKIPIWMLDALACRGTWQAPEPVAALSALVALRVLLSATTGSTAAIAFAPHRPGERHAIPPSPPADAGPATRPVFSEPAADGRCGAGMEHLAGAGPAGAGVADGAPADRPSQQPGTQGGASSMSADKIGAQHRARKAVLYVHQSSAHQVRHARESQALQYAMRERLVQLGWSEIDVIEDDLGRSAAGGVVRAGFERMVAEVCLGKIGAVAALKVSRFARNSRDWQQLVEMCRVVDTVLIDQETVYAP